MKHLKIMTKHYISEIEKQMALRRLKGQLWKQLQTVRPTLVYDTVYRALSRPDENTETLNWIRDEAAKMLAGLGVDIIAQEAVEAA